MKKALILISLSLFFTSCNNQTLSSEVELKTTEIVTPSVTEVPVVSEITTDITKENYTVQEGDTFFSIAVLLYPEKDLSATADTLSKLNPHEIKQGDIIVCPKKEDIPDYYIVIASSTGASGNITHYDGAMDVNNNKMESINSEIGIETTDFLVVKSQ